MEIVGTFCKVKEDKITEKYGSKGKYCLKEAHAVIPFLFSRPIAKQTKGTWMHIFWDVPFRDEVCSSLRLDSTNFTTKQAKTACLKYYIFRIFVNAQWWSKLSTGEKLGKKIWYKYKMIKSQHCQSSVCYGCKRK